MKNNVVNILKDLDGFLLGIGLDEKMLVAIQNNEKINDCFLLSKKSGNGKKVNGFTKGKEKTIHIKKLKKYFKRKSIDNIVCDYSLVSKFMRGFVSNSIYLNSGKLYLYGSSSDIDKIIRRYKWYKCDTEILRNGNEFLLIVDNNVKSNFFKDIFYKVWDLYTSFLDFLTDLLVNQLDTGFIKC